MLKKIVLAGGSGYLGQVLASYFKDKAEEIIILSRKRTGQGPGNNRTVVWDATSHGEWEKSLAGADMVINLCGKNVNCRYTEQAKAEIFRSRLTPTELLGSVIARLENPPKLWVNICSATIYRHAEDRPQDEVSGEIGTGFSVDVCKAWEDSFWKVETPKTRKIVLRVGLVLGRADGVFPRLKKMALFGIGGHHGVGRQYISWIHEHDFARSIEWLFEQDESNGVYNCTAPKAIQNQDFMKILRLSLGIPVGLPSPQWLLEIGARLMGTETELVLKSRWVYPKRLLDEGFAFQFPKPEHAIRELLSA